MVKIRLVNFFFFFVASLIFGTALNSDELNKSIPKYILKMEEVAYKGNPDVQYNLGLAYSNEIGISENFKKAIYWFEESALQGNVLAQDSHLVT